MPRRGRYQELKREGRCPGCGARQPHDANVYCPKCIRDINDRREERERKERLA